MTINKDTLDVEPASERTRLKRYHWLAKYDRDTINAIIDVGIVCQVGYVIDGAPYVTPRTIGALMITCIGMGHPPVAC